MLRPISFHGYALPISVSRNTDFPKFHLKTWFSWMDRGWFLAPDPIMGVPQKWSLAPPDVHSVIWWSKDYSVFLRHPRRKELDVYNQFFNMTITGDTLWEKNVPNLEFQLKVFENMVKEYGVERMQWRYSPVPLDITQFDRILSKMVDLGVKECYYSFLHPGGEGGLVQEPRDVETRRTITGKMNSLLQEAGMSLKGCWEDTQFLNETQHAKCVSLPRLNEIFGRTEASKEISCGCSASVEVATQDAYPCPHACSYCYAAPLSV